MGGRGGGEISRQESWGGGLIDGDGRRKRKMWETDGRQRIDRGRAVDFLPSFITTARRRRRVAMAAAAAAGGGSVGGGGRWPE